MGYRLSFLDKSFWLTESTANPKHVGCLQLLAPPDDVVVGEYVETLVTEMKSASRATPPFNCKVKAVLGYPVGLQPVRRMAMDYHIQLHVIDDITDKVALDAFVARLHESRLDPDKPLWQYHFIHDKRHDRFAIYARVHHLYGDGATLVRWFQAGYLSKPDTSSFVPVWAVKRLRRKGSKPAGVTRLWQSVTGALRTGIDLFVIFSRLLLKLVRINPHYMPIPFTGTKTVLTGQVKQGRAVATTVLDFDRVRRIAKRTRSTANEVLLCAFDIGVHRLLQDHGHVFKKSLFTNMPINLRKPGEKTSGNKIAIVPVELAHGETDPYLRLRQIIINHRIVKFAAQHARPGAFSAYTIVIQSLALVYEWLHLSSLVKPIANILVSNVPGPTDERYLKDSKLLACYPISTMTPGGGVNITLMTYAGKANIGMVCCNKNITSLQPLVDYFQEAFDMLEASVDDPSQNIEDIGEHIENVPVSIVTDTPQ
ncbi:wax ester/triacylglycerol synthase domain-containing protein [Alteromonas halophila]|uniref:diacylglycerol O-acyltransferase n=1 Tax=Alteromonas halophila TaxID=516698 RepID=A0A918JQ58_9ALTE|nr:wax ester/triacylglycerol synthase domain-containing protein [Alteromonas halophila]GGW94979.1 diacylglycerol O-acyltransferase [Alteromonas halophila]